MNNESPKTRKFDLWELILIIIFFLFIPYAVWAAHINQQKSYVLEDIKILKKKIAEMTQQEEFSYGGEGSISFSSYEEEREYLEKRLYWLTGDKKVLKHQK